VTPVSPVMPGSSLAPYQRPGIIYVARNRVNGKAYVGKTVSGLAIRKAAHRREAEAGSRCPFHRAIRKWGFETFEFVVLQECVGKSLLRIERIWISVVQSLLPNGYNLTPGGEEGTETAEHARRISQGKLGKKRPDMTGPNNPRFGRPMPEETRRKLSAATKRQMTPEAREFLSRIAIGRRHSQETRAKIAEIGRNSTYRGDRHPWSGRVVSEEERLTVSLRFKGKPKSAEQRAKISAALKRRKQMPVLVEEP